MQSPHKAERHLPYLSHQTDIQTDISHGSHSPQTTRTHGQLATHPVVPTSPARFCNSQELTEFRNTVSVHLITHDPSWEQPNKDTSRARSGKVSDGVFCVFSQWNQDYQPLCYNLTIKYLLNAHVLNV